MKIKSHLPNLNQFVCFIGNYYLDFRILQSIRDSFGVASYVDTSVIYCL